MKSDYVPLCSYSLLLRFFESFRYRNKSGWNSHHFLLVGFVTLEFNPVPTPFCHWLSLPSLSLSFPSLISQTCPNCHVPIHVNSSHKHSVNTCKELNYSTGCNTFWTPTIGNTAMQIYDHVSPLHLVYSALSWIYRICLHLYLVWESSSKFWFSDCCRLDSANYYYLQQCWLCEWFTILKSILLSL